MTALTASFSMLASRQMGGITPRTRAGSSGEVAIMAWTRSGVGGTMGSPSHHSRLTNSAKTSSSGRLSSLTIASATMYLLDVIQRDTRRCHRNSVPLRRQASVFEPGAATEAMVTRSTRSRGEAGRRRIGETRRAEGQHADEDDEG